MSAASRPHFVKLFMDLNMMTQSGNRCILALNYIEELTCMAESDEGNLSPLVQCYLMLSEAIEILGEALEQSGTSLQSPTGSSRSETPLTVETLEQYLDESQRADIPEGIAALRDYVYWMTSDQNGSPTGEPNSSAHSSTRGWKQESPRFTPLTIAPKN